jgi:hypothetical protein
MNLDISANVPLVFSPPRRTGVALHLGLIVILIGLAAFGLFNATQAQIGLSFLLDLVPALLALVFTPLLAYQAYALWTAYYRLERDGVKLRWGLRYEDIPMTEIEWVREANTIGFSPPLPVQRWPGAVLGLRNAPALEKSNSSGEIEYLASQARDLLYIGTRRRVFAISPTDRNGFLFAYQRLNELGSITPFQPRSQYPSILILKVWESKYARGMLLTTWLLSLVLLAWISLAIPNLEQIHLGFRPDGSPGDLAPAVQLLLLPVLNGMIVIANFIIGLFFYRKSTTQDLAYILWACGTLVPILFLFGTYFILNAR